jgi:O-antigen/teichoic acid export membrane protein
LSASWIRYLPNFIRGKVEGRHNLQKAIGNTGWLFVDNILRMGVGLLVSVWITRYLGPEQFGLLNFTTAFVMLFSSIALLGLDFIVVRNVVSNPSCRDEVLGTAFVLKLFGGIIASGLTLAAIVLFRPADHLTHVLVGITTIGTLFQAFGTIDFWFQSQVKSKYSAYARVTSYLIICCVKMTLILFHAPLVAFAWAGLADIILGSLGLVVAYRVNGHQIRAWRSTRTMALTLLKDSWPLMFTDIVILIYMRVDKIMIGELAGNTELGIYAVAALIAEALYFIPAAVTSSIFPSILDAKVISEELFYARLQQFYNLMALFGYAVALPVTFLAGSMVPLLFGVSYVKAAAMLVGLVWAGLFINLTMARNYYLTAMNWTRLHFITDFLGCVLNVSLNFYLIPRYGGMGAVIASCISYWFVVHGTCFIFAPLRRTGVMLTKALIFPKPW